MAELTASTSASTPIIPPAIGVLSASGAPQVSTALVPPPPQKPTASPVIAPPNPALVASDLASHNALVASKTASAPVAKAPDDASNKYNTATGALNPNYPDNQTKLIPPPKDYLHTKADTYTQDHVDNQDLLDKINKDYQDKITQFENGTFPLNPSQQAQIDGLKNDYNQLISQQKTANVNFTGATTISQERNGLSRYSPTMAAANIQKAVTDGISKVSNLESKAAEAVGQMTTGFEESNFKLVKEAHDSYVSAIKDKDVAIKEMYTEVQDQIKTAKTEASATTLADALSKLNDPTLTDTEKQTAVATALASGVLTAADSKELNSVITTNKKDAAAQQLAIDKYKLDVSNSEVENNLKRIQGAKIMNDMKEADVSSVQSWVQNIKSGAAKLSQVPKNLLDAVNVALANSGGEASDILLQTQNSLAELNKMVTDNHGFTSAVGFRGPIGTFTGPVSGTEGAAFASKASQVVNELVLPNLSLLRGLGRVTQTEFNTLKDALSALNVNTDKTSKFYGTSPLSEDDFKKQLKIVTDTIDQKVKDANQHNDVTLPSNTSASSDPNSYGDVTLPN